MYCHSMQDGHLCAHIASSSMINLGLRSSVLYNEKPRKPSMNRIAIVSPFLMIETTVKSNKKAVKITASMKLFFMTSLSTHRSLVGGLPNSAVVLYSGCLRCQPLRGFTGLYLSRRCSCSWVFLCSKLSIILHKITSPILREY